MSEADAVQAAVRPATRSSIAAQLREGGLEAGSCVIVHSSLSALGWVAGGPVAIIEALTDVLGPEGTLVMPSFSSHLSEPCHWQKPPVPASWHPIIEAEMPAYDPLRTPTWGMGKTAELFRTWPGVKRSSHPQNSFAALGPKAPEIVAEHPLDHPFGVCSPLEKLYQLGGQTLFLGVGFHRFTMLHLAETRAWPHRPREQQAAPVMEHNERVWKRFSIEPAGETGHFMPIGEALLANGIAQAFAVGAGRGMLVACRDAVDFALERWSKRPDPVFGTSGNER